MALPWQWILEKLALLPDMSVEAVRELTSYVPNAAQKGPLQAILSLRQLHEVLVAEDELNSSSVAPLITLLASPDEDISKLLEQVADADSGDVRRELHRYVQRKTAKLGTPVLDKIAADYSAGVYPVQKDSDSRKRHEEEPQEAPAAKRKKPSSVGSEDTTVVIEGGKENGEKAVSSGVETNEERVSKKRDEDATFLHNCKRICVGLGTKLFKQKESKAGANENGKDEQLAAKDGSEAGVAEAHWINVEPKLGEYVSVRRSKKKVLEVSGLDSDKAVNAEMPDAPEIGEDNNLERCYICEDGGELLCCDGCAIALHLECLGKKKDEISEGDWFCPSCVHKQAMAKAVKAKEEALQAKLLVEKVEEERKKKQAEYAMQETKWRQGKKTGKKQQDGSDESEQSSEEVGGDFRTSDNKTGREAIPGIRRIKIAWNELEEETLREGVAKFDSKWSTILKFGMGKFHPSRTGVDLKDKWRNIIKRRQSDSRKRRRK